ncbi:F-box protein [Quillaja saponaria]|uniref:F-box protein n=1 Tax=Quillaja saponaria TaxID=32244 RepID=A0AAD7KRI6_QUISA|nr:F-box protein [Quillaja saponaria]
MGQSVSTAGTSPELNRRDISVSSRFISRSFPVVVPVESNKEGDILEKAAGGIDYTSYLPDDCLAGIFHYLSSGDRAFCSVVCKRWLRVDGQSRHRLSLKAKAEILDLLPALFVRFDSVTKLALRCDRKSIGINDDALILISCRCRNLTRLKLRGCREITDVGMTAIAKNCKSLKKLSCGSCTFGAKGMNAVLDNCTDLEELSVKRLRGVHDGAELISAGTAASSLKSICLKELVNGQSFGPLLIGAKKLKTLKLIRCLGDWDEILEAMGNLSTGLTELHLEKVQVSDVGLLGISNCLKLETLRIVKTPECSNFGLVSVAEHCKQLRKLHIDGWRTNRIGDEGLIAVAKHCPNLQELVLIGIFPTSLSLLALASNCQRLERLALCGIGTIGDTEIEFIAAKCVALKKLCIKGCPVSDSGIEALALGCPNLVKIKVKKCRRVTSEVADWLRERRSSLVINFDEGEIEPLDGSSSDAGAQESGMEFQPTVTRVTGAGASSSSNTNRFTMFTTKFGFFAGRNLVPCAFRKWSNSDNFSSSSL